MKTETFKTAKEAYSTIKNLSNSIVSINGYDVTKGYLNVTNKHITCSDSKGVKVFASPFVVDFKN